MHSSPYIANQVDNEEQRDLAAVRSVSSLMTAGGSYTTSTSNLFFPTCLAVCELCAFHLP